GHPRIGCARSSQRTPVIAATSAILNPGCGKCFGALALDPPQLAFASRTFNVAQVPSASQFISAGFSPTIPFADPSHPIGVVRTTGPVRRMPRILEWNLGIQDEFSQNWVAQIGY